MSRSIHATQRPAVSIAELQRAAAEEVPMAGLLGAVVDAVDAGEVWLHLPYQQHFQRPGDSISGPAMMTLADFGMWAALLTLDASAHQAVTSNLSIDFLRRPRPGPLRAHARVLKHGRRLSMGTVEIFSDDDQLVAHVACTYAMPADRLAPGR